MADQAPVINRRQTTVNEFLDIVLKAAHSLAARDNTVTAEELLAAAAFYTPGDMARAKYNKVSAWNLAMKHEKTSVPLNVSVVPQSGGQGKGRPVFNGDYAKWLGARWKGEPSLREQYQRMADKMNRKNAGEDNDGDEDGPSAPPPIRDLKAQQKKALTEIRKRVCYYYSYAPVKKVTTFRLSRGNALTCT